jgi:TonB family protein
MFLFIDRYKLGILTAFAVYIGIFIYLEMQTYTRYFPIIPFNDEPLLELQKEELLLTPEQIQIQEDLNSGDLKNISRDQNDSRERSSENWQENKSAKEIEQSIKDYEKSLYQDNGGELERAKILKESEQRKNDLKKQAPLKPENKESSGAKTVYAGNVMVSWSLSQRTAHLNNNWYVRNPGYTCGQGSSGKITVQIKVNQNGSVIDAIVLSSGGASDCMTQQAIKYAKLSRFNYSSTASTSQVGTITYTFVSQ